MVRFFIVYLHSAETIKFTKKSIAKGTLVKEEISSAANAQVGLFVKIRLKIPQSTEKIILNGIILDIKCSESVSL